MWVLDGDLRPRRGGEAMAGGARRVGHAVSASRCVAEPRTRNQFVSATRIRRRLDCALDDRIPHWMASPYSRLKRALFDPEIFEAKVNQARADDSAKARVPNQQAHVDRARADVKNAPAAHAEGKTQTARVRVMVADAKRDPARKPDPTRGDLMAKRDRPALPSLRRFYA